LALAVLLLLLVYHVQPAELPGVLLLLLLL
jgi:hypothetical protein